MIAVRILPLLHLNCRAMDTMTMKHAFYRLAQPLWVVTRCGYGDVNGANLERVRQAPHVELVEVLDVLDGGHPLSQLINVDVDGSGLHEDRNAPADQGDGTFGNKE